MQSAEVDLGPFFRLGIDAIRDIYDETEKNQNIKEVILNHFDENIDAADVSTIIDAIVILIRISTDFDHFLTLTEPYHDFISKIMNGRVSPPTKLPAHNDVQESISKPRRRVQALKEKPTTFLDSIDSMPTSETVRKRVRAALRNPNNRLFSFCEFFYPDIDVLHYFSSDFVIQVNELDPILPYIKLNRLEWAVVKNQLGRMRRFTNNLITGELAAIKEYRDVIRAKQESIQSLPGFSRFLTPPPLLQVGTLVLAIHPTTQEPTPGFVISDPLNHHYKIRFYDGVVDPVVDHQIMSAHSVAESLSRIGEINRKQYATYLCENSRTTPIRPTFKRYMPAVESTTSLDTQNIVEKLGKVQYLLRLKKEALDAIDALVAMKSIATAEESHCINCKIAWIFSDIVGGINNALFRTDMGQLVAQSDEASVMNSLSQRLHYTAVDIDSSVQKAVADNFSVGACSFFALCDEVLRWRNHFLINVDLCTSEHYRRTLIHYQQQKKSAFIEAVIRCFVLVQQIAFVPLLQYESELVLVCVLGDLETLCDTDPLKEQFSKFQAIIRSLVLSLY
ncbi:hypothetical protein PCE1_003478 [Barthelona sp. PCE]